MVNRFNQLPSFSRAVSRALTIALTISLLGQSLVLPLSAQAGPASVLNADIRVTVTPADIQKSLPVPGAGRMVNMALHGVSIEDALRALAKKGGFNVLIDESVSGSLSVDLNNVTIQDALETIRTYGNLAYELQDRNLMVTRADSERGRNFNRTNTQIIPLRYANAKVLANLLNTTVFAPKDSSAASSSATTAPQKAVPDFHTNSLVIVGTPTDIETARQHIAALDMPRSNKTWRLSHANALDVAAQLSASLFNEGTPPVILQSGGGASSGSSGNGDNLPGSIRVQADKIQEGQGGSTQQASGSSGGSGGSSGQQSVTGSVTLRGRVKENQTVQISPQGAILIPDTRLNTVTLMGTAEQIAMAESLIPTLDRKVPQVVLEASLVEISEDGQRELGFNAGFNSGNLSYGFNNTQNPAGALINNPFTQAIGRRTSQNTPLENILSWTTNPTTRSSEFFYQINALIHRNKAKLLANPTVITGHDSETIISIVDEIIKSVTVTANGAGNDVASEAVIGEVGIVLNILPKIGADGSVNMRVRPTVSTLSDTIQDRFGNVINLVSRREVIAQNVSLHDGESFVLGGLLHDTDTDSVSRVPGLSKLPILGALARSSTRNKTKTELCIIITPHVINDDAQATQQYNPMHPASLSSQRTQGGIVPVSNTPGLPYSTPGMLPPLEPARVVGESSTADLMGTPAHGSVMPLRPAKLNPPQNMLMEAATTSPTEDEIQPYADILLDDAKRLQSVQISPSRKERKQAVKNQGPQPASAQSAPRHAAELKTQAQTMIKQLKQQQGTWMDEKSVVNKEDDIQALIRKYR